MLKIFLLRREDRPGTDENVGHVIVASSSMSARNAAGDRAADEGEMIWFSDIVTVLEMGVCTDELIADGTVLLTESRNG